MNTIKDYFGNEIGVGDKIVFARTKHTSLAIGQVTSIGKSGTYVMARILVAPFGGYYESAKEQIDTVQKVILTKDVDECVVEKIDDPQGGMRQFHRQHYKTKYVYAMKYTGQIPDNQYKKAETEKM